MKPGATTRPVPARTRGWPAALNVPTATMRSPRTADELRGKKARCRECQTLFLIGAAAPPAAPATPEPIKVEVADDGPPPPPAEPAPPAPPPVVEAVVRGEPPARRSPPPARRRPVD